MKDRNPKICDPFATFAKDAANCKAPERATKKKPTNALRPKPQRPMPLPSLFDLTDDKA